MSDIGDFHGLCVGFVVFWVGSLHMGGGALFAAKPGYAQLLGALGLNYSVVLSAWKYHARSIKVPVVPKAAPGQSLCSVLNPTADATLVLLYRFI